MKHIFLWAMFVMGVAFGSSIAQPLPVEVQGDGVKVVKVDKVVVVKIDQTVVNSFPFSVSAPSGAGLYFWQYPNSVEAIDKGDRLEVTSAPKGNLTISVKAVTADWDAKKFITRFGSVSLVVGEVPQPVPPGPTPPSPTPPGPTPPTPPVVEKYGFVSLCISEGAKLTPQAKSKAQALADNFEAVSAKLAATSAMTVDQANAELVQRNRATLTTDKELWLPFFTAWATKADELNKTNALLSRESYVAAYNETATGLRSIK